MMIIQPSGKKLNNMTKKIRRFSGPGKKSKRVIENSDHWAVWTSFQSDLALSEKNRISKNKDKENLSG